MGAYDKTIGTLMIGIVFNTYLFGLVTFQFAKYYRTKFNDPPAIKLMVLFLFILDTVHSASVIFMLWDYVVTNYANPEALSIGGWPLLFTPCATAMAAICTQAFLGYRIYRLTGSKILYGIILTISIPAFVVGMVVGAEAIVISILADLPKINNPVIAWLSMQVAADVMITVVLTTIFARSKTGIRRTDTVLNRLIRGTIQTGLFASIFSLGDLITFLTLPDTNLYGMFAIPIGRIYTNTLLDTLLTRDALRTELDAETDATSTTLEGSDRSTMRWANKKVANTTTGISLGDINITRTTNVTFQNADGSKSGHQEEQEDVDDNSVKTLKKGPVADEAV
ncbi:hypothetical protein QCA50_006678 [Cerrena zonata]|uniref:DUF6534 domain-containing protein n=1 Tax=Cerrena zonata TaxID=2478898 RepID=A0AAW0GIH4_9APHY